MRGIFQKSCGFPCQRGEWLVVQRDDVGIGMNVVICCFCHNADQSLLRWERGKQRLIDYILQQLI
jgi:hypothetical protein